MFISSEKNRQRKFDEIYDFLSTIEPFYIQQSDTEDEDEPAQPQRSSSKLIKKIRREEKLGQSSLKRREKIFSVNYARYLDNTLPSNVKNLEIKNLTVDDRFSMFFDFWNREGKAYSTEFRRALIDISTSLPGNYLSERTWSFAGNSYKTNISAENHSRRALISAVVKNCPSFFENFDL